MSAPDDRSLRIESELRAAFEPVHLELEDESHRHRGHAGAADGGGHYRVTIVSSRFEGRSRLERHRLVYEALDVEMGSAIHALAVRALTPEEWKR